MSTLKLSATPAERAKLKRDATRAGHPSLAAYLRSLAGLSQRQIGGKREGAGRPAKNADKDTTKIASKTHAEEQPLP